MITHVGQVSGKFKSAARFSGLPAPDMSCITSLTNIPMTDVGGTLFVSSTNSLRRMLLLGTDAGFTTEFLYVINTLNNTLIGTQAENSSIYGGAFAANVNKFCFSHFPGFGQGAVDFYDSDGVYLNTAVYSSFNPGQGLSLGLAYEPNTGKIYTTGNDLNSAWIIAIDPTTLAITSADTGGAPGPAGLFDNATMASPGMVYYEKQDNTGVVGVSVPSNTVVGTVNFTLLTHAFAYAANTGKIYLGARSPNRILEVNPATMAIDYTYSLTMTDRIKTIRYDPTQGRLIAFNRVGNGFVINPIERTVICTPDLTVPTDFDTLCFGLDATSGRCYFRNSFTDAADMLVYH